MSSMVQVDNEDVRVTRWTLRQGEETGPHQHEYDYVVVPLASARMCVADVTTGESTTVQAPGETYYRRAGAEHNVRNDDDAVVDFVEVELICQPTA